MINRDVMIVNLGIKKLQVINEKLRTQLKNENLATRTRQIRVEELEQWITDLGVNPRDEASVQALIKTKYKDIQVLKKKHNIPGIDHVQTSKLQAVKGEKYQLLKKMVQMEEQIDLYAKPIENLKGGYHFLQSA
jgi:hypothetical protein